MGWVAVAASITVLHESKTLSIGKTREREEKAALKLNCRSLRHNLAVLGGALVTLTEWLDLPLPCGRVRGVSEETRK
jgi:hypothetical protein